MGLSTPVKEFFLMKLLISPVFLQPRTAWGRWVGWGGPGEWEESEGEKTAAWQAAFPCRGRFLWRQLGSLSQWAERGRPSVPSLLPVRWGRMPCEVKHRQAADSSLLTWLSSVSKNFCWNWIYIFSAVL